MADGFLTPTMIEGTLLSYDSISARIIFETLTPLSRAHLTTPFQVLPCVDELLLAVKAKLDGLRKTPHALSWRLLNAGGAPRRV